MIPIHRQPIKNKSGDDKLSNLFNNITIVTSPLPPVRPILFDNDNNGNFTPSKLRRPPSKLKLSNLVPNDD
jgi:hypothetical protein